MLKAKHIKKNVSNLSDGDILAKDLYIGSHLILPNGIQLTSHIITLLKELNVSYAYVKLKKVLNKKERAPQFFHSLYEQITLINYEEMKSTFITLSETLSNQNLMTKLYIPVFRIVHTLYIEKKISELHYNKSIKLFTHLLKTKLIHLQEQCRPEKSVILLVEGKFQYHYIIKLFKGLFFAQHLYPFVIDANINETELTNIISCCNSHSVFLIQEQYEPVYITSQSVNAYHISPKQLEQIIFNITNESSLYNDLEKYKIIQKVIYHYSYNELFLRE